MDDGANANGADVFRQSLAEGRAEARRRLHSKKAAGAMYLYQGVPLQGEDLYPEEITKYAPEYIVLPCWGGVPGE